MRKIKPTYRVYAGYHEVYVTTHVLRRPLTLLSSHRKLSTALRAAEKHDAGVIYDTALRSRVATHYDTTPEQLQWMHFFDGKEQSIDNGLAEITLDNLSRELNVQPCAADAIDMANYKAHREKISLRKALALIEGLTYAQLKPMFI